MRARAVRSCASLRSWAESPEEEALCGRVPAAAAAAAAPRA